MRGMATLAAALVTLGRTYRRFDWSTEEDAPAEVFPRIASWLTERSRT